MDMLSVVEVELVTFVLWNRLSSDWLSSHHRSFGTLCCRTEHIKDVSRSNNRFSCKMLVFKVISTPNSTFLVLEHLHEEVVEISHFGRDPSRPSKTIGRLHGVYLNRHYQTLRMCSLQLCWLLCYFCHLKGDWKAALKAELANTCFYPARLHWYSRSITKSKVKGEKIYVSRSTTCKTVMHKSAITLNVC